MYSLYEPTDATAHKNFAVETVLRSISQFVDNTEINADTYERSKAFAVGLAQAMVERADGPYYEIKPSVMHLIAANFFIFEKFVCENRNKGSELIHSWLVCLPYYSKQNIGNQESVTHDYYAFYTQPVVDALSKLIDAGDKF